MDLTSTLFPLIEDRLDMDEIQRILLVLERDKVDFESNRDKWLAEKKGIIFIEKINPFSERDQKGEVLKLKFLLDDLSNAYATDKKVITELVMAAIKNVPAFVARFNHDRLVASISKTRSARGTVYSRQKAHDRAKYVKKSFIQVYRSDFTNCPSFDKLHKAFMLYLFEPLGLPEELER